jgi:hypothetical protein
MIPAGYSGGRQIAQTSTLAVVVLAAAVFVAAGAPAAGWLLVPAFWVFANFFEWTVHRYPMHRPGFPRFMYRNHAQIHHVAFTDSTMALRSVRELYLVMMPWYTIVLLLVAVAPVAILAGVIGGGAMVGVFYVAALSYFLSYEILHALYHVPRERLARFGIGRGRGLFAFLRAHHTHHHVMRRMAHVNFNVTMPLADVVMGTRERPGAAEAAGGAEVEASAGVRQARAAE